MWCGVSRSEHVQAGVEHPAENVVDQWPVVRAAWRGSGGWHLVRVAAGAETEGTGVGERAGGGRGSSATGC
jgi:hypothetical protein